MQISNIVFLFLSTRFSPAASQQEAWQWGRGSCRDWNAGLNFAAQAAGKKYFGTAGEASQVSNPSSQGIVANGADFGQITPEYTMKWAETEPQRNQFDFAKADALAAVVFRNHQTLRCHTLIWYTALPDWVSNDGLDRNTLIDVMRNHITTVVQHFKGKCYSWDVVNEALNDDGSYRDNVFLRAIGPEYITIAFQAAAAADPEAKLYYNEYNIENWDVNRAKINGVFRIVDTVRGKGARIDGIGLQGHFDSDALVVPTASIATVMSAFANKNLEVAITELDVRIKLPTTPSSISKQQTQYHNVIVACNSVSRCVGVTTWGYTDKYDSVSETYPGFGSALIWDQNLNKKQGVYQATLQGWGDRGRWPGCNGHLVAGDGGRLGGVATLDEEVQAFSDQPASNGNGQRKWRRF